MHKRQWIIPVLVATCLIGYSWVRPWFQDREDTDQIAKLTADLNAASDEIDQAIADTPQIPQARDLERMQQLNDHRRELVQRMKEVVPKLKQDTGADFRQAQDVYLKKTSLMGEKLADMSKKLTESKATAE